MSSTIPPDRRPLANSCRAGLNGARLTTLRKSGGLLGPEDLPRFPRIPILRRRLQSSKHHRVESVPGMDHNLLNTLGPRSGGGHLESVHRGDLC